MPKRESKNDIKLGYMAAGPLSLNRAVLLESRALITATSGAGKSHLLRRMLELVSETTQTIVLDPEGEFASLREIRDMVLIGPDGDISADPASASLLCRRLMELHLSAVIDLSDLTLHRRREFVAAFCTTMVELPRKLWHDCFVAIDELHEFAPDTRDKDIESREAVGLLAAKGRKRGFCLLGATQRLSNLSKDVAAELKNRFVGQSILDVDLRRSADLLGFGKERWVDIRDAGTGEFFAVGPALSVKGVVSFKGGPVQTTHPKRGQGRRSKPPKPSASLKKVLAAELKDLPQQAQAEIKDHKAMQAEINRLAHELSAANRAKNYQSAAPDPWHAANAATVATKPLVKQNTDLKKALEMAMAMIKKLSETTLAAPEIDAQGIANAMRKAEMDILAIVQKAIDAGAAPTRKLQAEVKRVIEKLQPLVGMEIVVPKLTAAKPQKVAGGQAAKAPPVEKKPAKAAPAGTPADSELGKGEKAVLITCAQHGDEGCSRSQITQITGYATSSRNSYISRLLGKSYLKEIQGGNLVATDEGVSGLGSDYEALPTGDALLKHYLDPKTLPEGERVVLKLLSEHYPNEMTREEISSATTYATSSRNAYISRLNARRLVDCVKKTKSVKASAILFD